MTDSTHQTGRFKSGDVNIFYRQSGKPGATPLLIAHGLSYFSFDWIETASALASDRQVIVLDTRGFGESDCSPGADYAVPTLARDQLAALEHLGWPEVILIGHSMSGRSTSFLAAENPARVKGLVLVDYVPENAPAGSKRVTEKVGGQPDVFESIDAAMRYFDVDPVSGEGRAKRARFEAFLRSVAGGFQLKRDLHFRNQFRRVLETGERPKLGVDMWQVLGRVACPVLSIRGSRSDMYAAETVPKMKASNPLLNVVEVDAGHNVASENLPGFLAAVRPFIQSLEARREHAA